MSDWKRKLHLPPSGSIKPNRRAVLAGGAAAAALTGVALLRPRKNGAPHSDYFRTLSAALATAGLARPALVIDKALLHENIAEMQAHLRPGMGYRIVAKSIPSLALIKEVREQTGTNRLMVFHQPFLNLVATEMPDADILLGKPMPVAAMRRFHEKYTPSGFDPATQIQWLIDTPERLTQYGAAAGDMNLHLRVNIEIDVGLHRGGVRDQATFLAMLQTIAADERLTFSGVMGYDPHLASVPGLLGWQRSAIATSRDIYRGFAEIALGHADGAPLTLNTAGSPTYRLHDKDMIANEVAVGSALVKPTHFDVPTLARHVPAAFIATPVLKALERTRIPALEALETPMTFWDRNQQRSFFIYGGNWLAEPVSPPGLQINGLFGRSSNQEMLNGSDLVDLAPDDYVFLRPAQSEFVFLQFGDIAVYEDGAITQSWPVFTQGA